MKLEALAKFHNRSDFDCGVKELNNFIKKSSFQNQKKHISKTFVVVDERAEVNTEDVIGFYTLSTGQIKFDSLPQGIKHPRYPVSIARVARLVVDLRYQGMGVGGLLLYDALQRIRSVSQEIGIFAIVVDAKDTKAKSFYERYGFVSLQDTDLTLCLTMKVIEQLSTN